MFANVARGMPVRNISSPTGKMKRKVAAVVAGDGKKLLVLPVSEFLREPIHSEYEIFQAKHPAKITKIHESGRSTDACKCILIARERVCPV